MGVSAVKQEQRTPENYTPRRLSGRIYVCSIEWSQYTMHPPQRKVPGEAREEQARRRDALYSRLWDDLDAAVDAAVEATLAFRPYATESRESILQTITECVEENLQARGIVPSPRGRPSRPKISVSKRLRIMERDAYRCKHCGGWESLQIDHITPVSKGGGNEDDNLQVLCRGCNTRKGSYHEV